MGILSGRKMSSGEQAPALRKTVTRKRLMEILGEDYLSPDNFQTRLDEPNEFCSILHLRRHRGVV